MTPTNPVEGEVNHEALAEYSQASDQYLALQAEKETLMDLGRRLGQMETAAFLGNISDGVMLSAYENVKKSKAWALLTNKKTGNYFQNLDEFCQEKLGYSARRLAQVSGNRSLIGNEAFGQAEQLGLRQIDYNAIKSLPAPEQELVRRAVEDAKSRDEVLDLLQSSPHGMPKKRKP